MDFRERLSQSFLFADGGMGSLLQARGLPAGASPEAWNLERPEQVRAVHQAYLEAGADFMLANTFGANPVKAGDKADAWVRAGVQVAREARAVCGREGDAWVALDIGPTGKLLRPLGDLDFEAAYAAFSRQVKAGVEAGADLFVIETMADTYELKAAVLAAREFGRGLPVLATATFDARGKLLTGGDVASVVALLEGLRVDALGLNCGLGPVEALEHVREFVAAASIPVMVKPNAGLPKLVDGCTVYDVGPEPFAEAMAALADAGARILGGCCGTTPAHIQALCAHMRGAQPKPLAPKARTVISSYTHALEITPEAPILIGERINPTGKKRFKQALAEGDIPYILRQGIDQQEAGAQALDVNVGLPGIDEAEMMRRVVTELQGVLDLPLQLDTSDPAALEVGLRLCNGKPLLNSVNGKRESLETVLPLAAKYGAVVVCLCLDESGIPETAEGRFRIAEKIRTAAASFGIGLENLVFDPLCLTVSSDPAAARVTLDTIRLLRTRWNARTVLGVSNVSFGLPRRELLNATFFTMAMREGLSAGIVNPNNAAMMDAYRAYRALLGIDAQCADYIEAAARAAVAAPVPAPAPAAKATSAPAPAPAAAAPAGLRGQVLRGLKSEAAASTRRLLADGREALELIDQELVPALDEVGRGFEAGTLFLPQLLAAADAASVAFEEIKAHLLAHGNAARKLGKIILATVQGDIHEIGKNIVRVLLENYGFEVIDLGKDVPPETVLEAVRHHQVRLVGLSALMTTTVGAMERTIALLHREAPGVLVMVGGAVLTQEYADSIHADFYGKHAMESVRYALRIFQTA